MDELQKSDLKLGQCVHVHVIALLYQNRFPSASFLSLLSPSCEEFRNRVSERGKHAQMHTQTRTNTHKHTHTHTQQSVASSLSDTELIMVAYGVPPVASLTHTHTHLLAQPFWSDNSSLGGKGEVEGQIWWVVFFFPSRMDR